MKTKEALQGFPYEQDRIPEILQHYDQFGFAILSGLKKHIVDYFSRRIFEISGLTIQDIEKLESETSGLLPAEMRKTLARVAVEDEIRHAFISEFRSLLLEMLGPIIHASRDFHVQVKGGRAPDYILQGYFEDNKEVEAPYGLHQDFPAGRVTTSPSMVIFWIPLTTSEFPALELYPGSHKRGLICNRWIRPKTKGLEKLGSPVDILPQVGNVLIFNAMLLHASRVGPSKRVSCDLRFFPFCGVLDSTPCLIADQAVTTLQEKVFQKKGDTLQAPLWETMAYLGHSLPDAAVARHSALHWSRHLDHFIHSDLEAANRDLRMMVNDDLGFERAETFLDKYSRDRLDPKPYAALLPLLPADSRERCRKILGRNGLQV